MEIWPAVDLRDGKCVRLQQGDYNRETVFSSDPVDAAKRWESEGASFLHIVDLDGARSGSPSNREVIGQMAGSVKMVCEVGGGIRNEASIKQLLELGVDRVVIGTKAVTDFEWLSEMSHKYPNKLVVGIDAKNGYVATDGWESESQTTPIAMAESIQQLPVAAVIYTDIATDGMMKGPNLSAMSQMKEAVSTPVVASGGVTTVDDLVALAAIPMAGAIVGRALYENKLTVRDAIAAANNATQAP